MKALIVVVSTLVISGALMLAYPDHMIKPGALSEGHQALNRDCMACHDLFGGAAVEKCTACHKVAEIGRRTVAGAVITTGMDEPPFHQRLANQDCAGCHTIHTSARPRPPRPAFQHDYLLASAKNDCAACHLARKPDNATHQQAGNQCVNCHQTDDWRGGAFDHQQVVASQAACAPCHEKHRPDDGLHRQLADDCRKCHSPAGWRQATFEHSASFRFDGNHPATCSNCHTAGMTYKEYTCYGCHEHNPARIAAKHREEGIGDFENCARCHRSGNAEEGEHEGRGERKGEREGGEGREHDDD